MNWAQFKDPVSHLCLACYVVTSWSLSEEVIGSSPFTVITNIFEIFVSGFAEFSETFRRKFRYSIQSPGTLSSEISNGFCLSGITFVGTET